MASVCHLPLCAMTRQTVMMAVTRPLACPSPAALRLSSATTLFVSRVYGPVTVTPTVQMAQTNGPAIVAHRDQTLPFLTSAHPWSFTVKAESASTAAGGVIEVLTAWTNQMKLTVVKAIAESSLKCTSFILFYSSKILPDLF